LTKLGYRSVLLREEAYEKIKEIAKKEDISICKAITKILSEYIEKHENET
jgi:predicted DNA-binding ribbon-helix-helix protein